MRLFDRFRHHKLNYLVAAPSRGGSMFLLHLMRATFPDAMLPLEKVSSTREGAYRRWHDRGYPSGFVHRTQAKSLKLEDPGLDQDARLLAQAFPDARVLTSYRPIEKIVASHAAIRPWGMAADKVVGQWIAALDFYEAMQAEGRLFILEIDAPEEFELGYFAAFMGTTPPAAARAFAADWPLVNTLAEQRAQLGDTGSLPAPLSRAALIDRFPGIPEATERYRNLIYAGFSASR
ncbi:hypothetical protein [Halovulum sp. GXIMD14793]